MTSRPLLFGVIDGYASEGGFDVPGGIATCYAPAVGLGRVASPGNGDDLWSNYEAVFRAAKAIGLDGVALTVEWARVAPHYDTVDHAAWERYREMLTSARAAGLEVSITVVGEVWPSWLGQEAWLLPWVEDEFALHVERLMTTLGDLIHSVRLFTRDVASDGFLHGAIPPWRTRARDDARDALAAIERMSGRAAARPDVASKVRRTKDVLAQLPESVWSTVLARQDEFDEIHIATLLPGDGPTALDAYLLRRGDTGYEGELPAALRR